MANLTAEERKKQVDDMVARQMEYVARLQGRGTNTSATGTNLPGAGNTLRNELTGVPSGGGRVITPKGYSPSNLTSVPSEIPVGPSVDTYTDEYTRVGTGIAPLNKEELAKLGATYDQMINNMAELSNDWSQGKIPDDVTAEVRRIASEKAGTLGLGEGSAARNLMARDLGLVSLQIQEKGATLSGQVAALAEGKSQFMQTYAMDARKLLEDIRRTDISALQLVEASRQANQELRERARESNQDYDVAIKQIQADLVKSYHQIAQGYSLSGMEGVEQPLGIMTGDFKDLLNDLKGTLSS